MAASSLSQGNDWPVCFGPFVIDLSGDLNAGKEHVRCEGKAPVTNMDKEHSIPDFHIRDFGNKCVGHVTLSALWEGICSQNFQHRNALPIANRDFPVADPFLFSFRMGAL